MRSLYLYIEMKSQIGNQDNQIKKHNIMKSIKYVIALLVMILIGFATSTDAYSKDKDQFKKMETALVYGLSSDVHGVIESALFNAVNYKVVNPKFESEEVVDGLRKIALEGSSHSLRFKAYLTLTYFTDQDEFDAPETLLTLIDRNDENKIFFYLQNQVQDETVTASN